ncbi:MAG: putative glycosyltransferase [Parcubacteria group bacterium Gr01-1014_106]|nr:MAG: putative glycosyltransferase [Parcubacteria group bacterium Gr01-1014_106]
MKLSIIILNWNTGDLLRKCLDALPAACSSVSKLTTHPTSLKLRGIRNSQLEYEVFVVDNASVDDSFIQARNSIQPFREIALPQNMGFAHANNVALREAKGEILLLLNPDTEPRPGSMRALVDFFSSHPRAGIVGGKLFYPDGRLQRSVRAFPSPAVLALLLTRLAHFFPKLSAYRQYDMADFSYTHDAPVDQVMGACFAIRRDALKAIGVLDEGYWIWFEEVDYCRRAKQAGWETWFTRAAEIVHHHATSFAQVSPLWRAWQFSRSALRYAWKYEGPVTAFLLALAVPVSLGTALLATMTQAPPSARSHAPQWVRGKARTIR